MIRTRPTLAALANDRRGLASLEMALCAAFVLLPLYGGITGLGQGLALQARLDRGIHGALIYAYGNTATLTAATPATVTSNLTTAIQNAYGTTDPAVVATIDWYCLSPTATRSGTKYTTKPTCTAPAVAEAFVDVSASVSFSPLVNAPISGWNQSGGTRGLVTISSTATVRIQ